MKQDTDARAGFAPTDIEHLADRVDRDLGRRQTTTTQGRTVPQVDQVPVELVQDLSPALLASPDPVGTQECRLSSGSDLTLPGEPREFLSTASAYSLDEGRIAMTDEIEKRCRLIVLLAHEQERDVR